MSGLVSCLEQCIHFYEVYTLNGVCMSYTALYSTTKKHIFSIYSVSFVVGCGGWLGELTFCMSLGLPPACWII